MFKNATTNQISILLAFAVGTLNSILFCAYQWLLKIEIHYLTLFLVSVVSVIFSYIIIKIILDRYVFRRIKLIYKIIRRHKLDESVDKKQNAQDYNLGEVNAEVVKWARSTASEIQYLKKLETYRRNFVGNVSHELRTPIFSIEGFIHTLLEGGLYDEKINRNYLERAASNVNRMKTIVEDLEVINRLESGEIGLNITKFDIRNLVQEVFDDLEILASEKSIELTFKDGADQAYLVRADHKNILQVLVNLITNSIKYGKEDGTTKASFYALDKTLLIEISDNGIGMDKKHLNHVFDRFYRIDPSRSRQIGGSGLGLSIVKHIIEAHGETINVRSTLGIGSTFGFTLPRVL